MLQLFLSEEWFLELKDMVLEGLASLIDIVVLFWPAMLVKRVQTPLVSTDGLFALLIFSFAAVDGVCEPSMLVVGLCVVVVSLLLFFCCCCACFCLKRRVVVRRNLLDEF